MCRNNIGHLQVPLGCEKQSKHDLNRAGRQRKKDSWVNFSWGVLGFGEIWNYVVEEGRTIWFMLALSAWIGYWLYWVLSSSRKTDPSQLQSSCCLNAWRRGFEQHKRSSVTATLQLLDATHLDTRFQRKSYHSSFQGFCEQHLQRASSQKNTPFWGEPHPTAASIKKFQPVQPTKGLSDRPYLLRLPQWIAQGILVLQLSFFLCLTLLPSLPSIGSGSLGVTKACLVTKVTLICSWGISLWRSLKTTRGGKNNKQAKNTKASATNLTIDIVLHNK